MTERRRIHRIRYNGTWAEFWFTGEHPEKKDPADFDRCCKIAELDDVVDTVKGMRERILNHGYHGLDTEWEKEEGSANWELMKIWDQEAIDFPSRMLPGSAADFPFYLFDSLKVIGDPLTPAQKAALERVSEEFKAITKRSPAAGFQQRIIPIKSREDVGEHPTFRKPGDNGYE